MAGVIDTNGVQWEHCNSCGAWTRIDNLGYEPPSRNHRFGRDLCIKCVNALSQRDMKKVQPAAGWLTKWTKPEDISLKDI